MTCDFKLIRHNGPQPPGYFAFQDPVTGQKFNGEGSIRDVATRVAQHRLANAGKFDQGQLNLDNIVVEIDCYTCLRLGNDRRWCTDGKPGNPTPVFRVSGKICPDCAVSMNERLCPTCGGRKVTGYTCPKCGKEFEKA